MNVFVDTSAWLAVLQADERRHQETSRAYADCLKSGSQLVTTSLVLGELYTLMTMRPNMRPDRFWDFLSLCRRSPSIEIVNPSGGVIDAAWKLLLARPDQRYSFVDAVSFVHLRAHQIRTALTLDHQFGQEGFATLPGALGAVHERGPAYDAPKQERTPFVA